MGIYEEKLDHIEYIILSYHITIYIDVLENLISSFNFLMELYLLIVTLRIG